MTDSSFLRSTCDPTQLLELHDFFDKAHIGINISTPSGRFLSANPAMARMFGYESPDDLVTSITDIAAQLYADPRDRAEFMRLIEERDQVFEHECRFKRKDGSLFWAARSSYVVRDEQGNVACYRNVITNITDRKQKEYALQRQISLTTSLLDNIPDLIFYKDVSGVYVGCNTEFAEFVGKSAEEIVGKTDYDLFDKETADFFRDHDRKMLDQGSARRNEEWISYPDGRKILLDTLKAPYLDAAGNVLGVIGISRDITERIQAQETLRQSEKKYHDLSKLFRLMADTMPDMLWAKNLNKEYIFANNALCSGLLNAADTDEPLGKTDLFFAMRERDAHPDNPGWHTFGEICRDSDEITLENMRATQFAEFGNVRGKFLYLDVRKAPFFDHAGQLIGVVGSARDVTAAKEAENRLNQLSQAVEQSPASVVITNAAGAIEYVNPKFTQITGYTLEEAKGLNPSVLKSGEQPPEYYRQLWQAISSGREWRGEFHNRKKNGELFWESASISPIKDSAGVITHYVAVKEDITDRKREDEARARERADRDLIGRISTAAITARNLLHFQQQLLPLLGGTLDVSRAYIFEYRHHSRSMDNTAEWTAPGVTSQQGTLQGIPADTDWWWITTLMRGESIRFADIADIPDQRTRDDLLLQDIRSILVIPLFIGSRFCGFMGLDECRRQREWSLREQHLLAEAARIHAGVLADEDLRREEERFRGILRNVDTVAVQGYSLDGTVTFWNSASETFYGYSAEEAMGRNLLDLIIPPAMRDEVRTTIRRMIDTGENIPASELTLMRKDGSPIPVFSSHAFVQVPGRDAELFCIDVDHSEIQATHRRLAQARDAAEAANTAKSEFLANMSHEIRTPLNGILGMLQLLETSPLSEEQSQYCSLAIESTNRLTKLLSDILDLSRIEAGKTQLNRAPFCLREIIGHVVDLFTPIALRSKVDLQCYLSPRLPSMMSGDALRVQQILINLIGNAFKFTLQGYVRLEIHPLPATTPDTVRLFCSVADTGQGVPDEAIATLFTPFTQAAQGYCRTHQGAGLGLSICKHLVTLMNGSIAMESELGGGTSVHFCITLGAFAGHCDPIRPKERSAPVVQRSRILVVEDDEVTLLAMRSLLQKSGYIITEARNGREAVELVEGGDFDLIVMDVQMPVMDGLEATRRIRESAPAGRRDTPIIALTAYAMPGDRERFLDAGMNDYLAKPVDNQALSRRIAQTLARGETLKN